MDKKTKLTEPFTQIPNRILNDKNLSLAEKGLIGIMLSNSESWQTVMEEIYSRSTNGVKSQQATYKKLKQKGYATQVCKRNPQTKKFEWINKVNIHPSAQSEPMVNQPMKTEPIQHVSDQSETFQHRAINNTQVNNNTQNNNKKEEPIKQDELKKEKEKEKKEKIFPVESNLTEQDKESQLPEWARGKGYDPKDFVDGEYMPF